MKTDGAAVVSRLLFRPFHLLFGTSFYGSFAVLSGFFCGYPMGAKIIADLLLQGKISLEEASYLLSFCNNASPSFIITFLVLNTIHQKAFCIPALLLLFGTMILLSFLQRILRHFIKNKDWIFPEMSEIFTQENSHFFKTTDAQNEFFCVRILYPEQFRNACKSRRLPDDLFCTSCIIATSAIRSPGFLLLKSSLEMTNGILLLSQSLSKPQVLYPLLLALTTFGGWCFRCPDTIHDCRYRT